LRPVDHIVSMVGDSMAGGFLQTAPQTMQHVLRSKFLTNWAIGRHAARTLAAGGSLTYTSGTGGRPHEISATYVANLAISALVQGLAHEMAPRQRVNAVAPTFMGTGTAFWRNIPPAELGGQQACRRLLRAARRGLVCVSHPRGLVFDAVHRQQRRFC